MSIPSTSGIYCIKSKIDSRRYIGSSNNLKRRVSKHLTYLKSNKHHNRYLQSFYNKYGKDSLEIVIVELCSVQDLIQREQFYMDISNSVAPNGFNLSPTAKNCQGYKFSPEQRENNSACKRGKKFSKKRKANLVKALTGIKKGPMSSAHKQNLSDSKSFPVYQYDKVGNFIREWKGVPEIHKVLGFSKTPIAMCLKGCKYRHTAHGYIWKYKLIQHVTNKTRKLGTS